MPPLVPNTRSSRIEESATLLISGEAARLAAAGHDVVSLGAGEPDFPTPEPIARAGAEAIARGDTRYTPAAGLPALRAAAASWLGDTFGLGYAPHEVMVCAGAKAALHMALGAVVEPGDRVLILTPYWVSYPALVAVAGGVPVLVEGAPDRGFALDVAAIERTAAAHGARGLIVNFPNNPSGLVPARDELMALVDVARRLDLWLLSDEIYAQLVYDGAEHVSPAGLPGGRERTLVVSGFTKSHSMTGWRISFLAGPGDVVAAAIRVQSQVLGNPCTISQAAALAACRDPLPDELRRRQRAFDERRRFLIEAIGAVPGLAALPPQGAFYALIDMRAWCVARGLDDIAICKDLLAQQHLALVPGSAFGARGFARASYAAPIDRLREAVRRLRAYAESA